ncbi:putative integral membrane protein [Acanthocheilonema viteae]
MCSSLFTIHTFFILSVILPETFLITKISSNQHNSDEAWFHIQWVPIVQRNFTEMIDQQNEDEIYQNRKMTAKSVNGKFKQYMQNGNTGNVDRFSYSSSAIKFNNQICLLFTIWLFITFFKCY